MITEQVGQISRDIQEYFVSVDVGGTKTRVTFLKIKNNTIESRLSVEKFIKSKHNLKEFIESEVVKMNPVKCAIDFAGPVEKNYKVRMTNWFDNPIIELEELINWGLPKNTIMLNDLEAAALGLLKISSESSELSPFVPLYEPIDHSIRDKNASNMVLLVPGTGLGTAGIIRKQNGERNLNFEIIPSEIQHFMANPIDNIHGELIDWLKETKNKNNLSWEDFSSGQGLVDIYEYISGKDNHYNVNKKIDLFKGDAASEIAKNAINNNDSACIQSLCIYYRCMARVAQMMSLVFQPYGGVFLGGTSIIKNKDFIESNKCNVFIRDLHNNKQKDLLKKFPIYLVEEDLVNYGCFWAGKKE